jgi:adenylate cyclase
MKSPRVDPAFERALAGEIAASELMRIRVITATLAILLIADQCLFLFDRDLVERIVHRRLPTWLPLQVVGFFLAYEVFALLVLSYRFRRGKGFPLVLRFINATVETSLPTYILWVISGLAPSPLLAFGSWPVLLYFIFIIASTLRLDFVLSAYTGFVAAVGFLGLAFWRHALDIFSVDLLYYWTKAIVMLVGGVVAGLVALRLRAKFRRAVEEAASRERVTNLFGQHVSPAVVDRLLDSPSELPGDSREICVMFLDMRDFTANARQHRPEEVVAFLNAAFAFMIEAIDRNHGFINKFLGDGFMAIFGAPLPDPAAARHAVTAAREILAEIDRRGLVNRPWPLKVGIGLHLGPAVTGNVGSPRRKEFTAIGDTVNLASRLEQLTKTYAARLIISEAVLASLGNGAVAPTPLGAVAVKGYAEPVPIWRLE